ncbi:unnamed protein product [Cutaneotrichosporon oleaginosum]
MPTRPPWRPMEKCWPQGSPQAHFMLCLTPMALRAVIVIAGRGLSISFHGIIGSARLGAPEAGSRSCPPRMWHPHTANHMQISYTPSHTAAKMHMLRAEPIAQLSGEFSCRIKTRPLRSPGPRRVGDSRGGVGYAAGRAPRNNGRKYFGPPVSPQVVGAGHLSHESLNQNIKRVLVVPLKALVMCTRLIQGHVDMRGSQQQAWVNFRRRCFSTRQPAGSSCCVPASRRRTLSLLAEFSVARVEVDQTHQSGGPVALRAARLANTLGSCEPPSRPHRALKLLTRLLLHSQLTGSDRGRRQASAVHKGVYVPCRSIASRIWE